MNQFLVSNSESGLTDSEISSALTASLQGKTLRRVLIIPPDFTRYHSYAGFITNRYYHLLTERGTEVDILPALGTHVGMTEEECAEMFGDIPYGCFIPHNWRTDVVKLGQVPARFLNEITDGLWNEPVDCEINKLVVSGGYDLILSLGQVVPHEVVGMSNHAKNLFVGVGGSDMINKSHMVGAVYGMERMMGKDLTPVRMLFDYSLECFLKNLPILFVLTVTTAPEGVVRVHGLFIGKNRKGFEAAVALSQKKNIDFVDRGIRKCVVYLDPKEFKSTWLGNKAVYRTRMAVANGGELIILAPGVSKFGEDPKVDALIRKYGYCGREKVLSLFHKNEDLKNNMGAAAHLIHGSSDGRFRITYAVSKLSKAEIEGVFYRYEDYAETVKKYDPDKLSYGWNVLENREEIYYIPNPALGLWIDKNRFTP